MTEPGSPGLVSCCHCTLAIRRLARILPRSVARHEPPACALPCFMASQPPLRRVNSPLPCPRQAHRLPTLPIPRQRLSQVLSRPGGGLQFQDSRTRIFEIGAGTLWPSEGLGPRG